MSSEQIVFFDIPSRAPGTCWSLNLWKTRLLLNYKGLDYRTEWLEYPDIKPRLAPHLPPNTKGHAYSLPTILLPSGEYIMDSASIAARLDADHPSPPLNLSSPVLTKVYALVAGVLEPIRPVFTPRVVRDLLNPASHAYWYETREKAFGMKLDQLEVAFPTAGCWDKAEGKAKEATALLKEGQSKGGPFFEGEQVSYADFVWAGLLLFFQRIGEDVLEELLKRSGDAEAHRELLKAVEPWSRRAAE